MQKRKLVGWVVVAYLLGCGIYMAFYGWTRARTFALLENRGVYVEGRVVSHSVNDYSKRSKSWYLVVEFSPTNHPAIKKEFTVDGEIYRTAVADGKASVRYLPQDPSVSEVGSFAGFPFKALFVLGLALVGSGLFCAIRLVLDRSRIPMAGSGKGNDPSKS